MSDKEEWKWDQRQQKLIITARKVTEDKKAKTKRVVETVETHNKKSAIRLKTMYFKQMNDMKKFFDECDRLKALYEKKEKLPYYKEVVDVMDALRWEADVKTQQQYIMDKKQFESLKSQYEKLDKALPNFNV